MRKDDPKSPDALNQQKAGWLSAAPIALLSVWLIGVSTFGRQVRSEAFDQIVLSVIAILFAAASLWTIGWMGKINRTLGLIGALAASPLFLWQFREIFRVPDRKTMVPIACLIAALVLLALAAISARLLKPRQLFSRACAACLLFAATMLIA